MYITPQETSFFYIQCTFHSPGTRGFFFSRAVGRFVVDCGPTDLRPKSRAAWLDRNRKPRMNSLWHPSYSFFVLCAEEDCTFFPILLSVCVLCHKTEFLEMSMLHRTCLTKKYTSLQDASSGRFASSCSRFAAKAFFVSL